MQDQASAWPRAVIFDLGGVVFPSPFDVFDAYEREHGLPVDHIRTVNATNPHGNAWALLERNGQRIAVKARHEAEWLRLPGVTGVDVGTIASGPSQDVAAHDLHSQQLRGQHGVPLRCAPCLCSSFQN